MRRLYRGDNLAVLREIDDASVDAIITDPPFNINSTLTSLRFDATFTDKWSHHERKHEHDVTIENILDVVAKIKKRGLANYLDMMVYRIIEFERILKSTGSLFLHVNQEASHYIKILLDYIFGQENYRNDIAWCYVSAGVGKTRALPRKFDIIFFYAKSLDNKYTALKYPYSWEFRYTDEDGRKYRYYSRIRNQRVYEDSCGFMANWWTDLPIINNMSKKRRYPTQKPQELYERIIKIATDKDDLILDPFAGSGTTLVAAENLERRWIGIDQNPEAVEIIENRFLDMGYGMLFPAIEVINHE